MLVYSSLLALVLAVGAPYWLARMMTSGRYRAGLAGRLGKVPAELRAAVTGRDVVWVHAVSVGEVLAASRLVEELRQAMPGVVIAVSTTTATGQALARERFGGSPVFYLPLDFGFLMRRYLEMLRPKLVVLMESELWPNMIRQCTLARVPVAVVNARVSDRSFPRYMKLRRVWGPLLREVTVFLAQSEETAERLRAMGVAAERAVVTGNLKYDVRAGAATPIARRVEALLGGARLLVAGSTLPGEEEILMAAWEQVCVAGVPARLLIAPRHPDRFEAVDELLHRSGFVVVRCSGLMAAAEGSAAGSVAPGAVLLLDTIGDLATVYGVAAVAFVGGSLVQRGGHNPLEPAQFGVAVVMGGSYENFRGIVETMRAEEAIRIVTAEGLAGALTELLGNKTEATALGKRGRKVFKEQQGATARVVRELMGLVR